MEKQKFKKSTIKIIGSLLFLLLFFSTTISLAKKVELQSASQVAINKFAENSGISKSLVAIKKIIPFEEKGDPILRIFNMIPNGYIVVSADDNTEPVLGYCSDTNFNLKEAPPSLLFLLNQYKREILYIRKKGIIANDEIKKKWEDYSSPKYINLKSYVPGNYILETVWNQWPDFNQYCPLDPNTGNRCIVGCCAVALGQILYHWGCLVTPQGTKTYTPAGFSNSLSVNFGNQNYDWDNMDITWGDDDNALLLYHCGVALESDYTDSSTAAYASEAETALETYFGFETDGYVNKSSYSSNTWASMLKADIDAFRPIFYKGEDPGGDDAHAWVVDGYNSSNEFHCNWGWSYGIYNGWFSLTDLTPGVDHDYTSTQAAIMGAHPISNCFNGISGNDLVCSSNTTYSKFVPTCCTISWSKSSSLNEINGHTNSTYTVSGATSGTSGYVTATIKNSQDHVVFVTTKDVWVGAPVINNISGPTYTPNGQWATYYAELESDLSNPTDYSWILNPLNGNSVYDYGWSCDIAFYNSGSYQLVVQAQNTCSDPNYGPYYVTGIEVYDDYYLLMTPNPTQNETTLTIKATSIEENTFDEIAEWEMEIYNESQLLKEKKTSLRGKNTKIQTAGWKEGIYLVRVKYKDQILTGKLVVKK